MLDRNELPPSPDAPSDAMREEDEAYELGRRDGYEDAVQEIDYRTGGDGEFYGSTIPGRGQDVPSMLEDIVERFNSLRPQVIEECAKVADYGVERAHRDWRNSEKADGAQEMAAEIASAIRSRLNHAAIKGE